LSDSCSPIIRKKDPLIEQVLVLQVLLKKRMKMIIKVGLEQEEVNRGEDEEEEQKTKKKDEKKEEKKEKKMVEKKKKITVTKRKRRRRSFF
jgi:hypothetical protein